MRGKGYFAALLALVLALVLLPCAAMAADMDVSGILTRVDISAGKYGPMELKDKHVYMINGDATFNGQEGTNELKRSGMFMFAGETAVIYVPKGVTLTVTGVDARKTDVRDLGGAPGIYVPEGANLVLIGNGTSKSPAVMRRTAFPAREPLSPAPAARAARAAAAQARASARAARPAASAERAAPAAMAIIRAAVKAEPDKTAMIRRWQEGSGTGGPLTASRRL